MNSVVGGLRWGLDRMLAVGYGVLYDYIFDRFPPYQALRAEVTEMLEGTVPAGASRRDVHVLDVACGPGNMTVNLAESGFSVTGVDPYGALVEVAREKRRAQRLTNVAFRHGDLARSAALKSGAFDRLVNIHSLYLPRARAAAARGAPVLKPAATASSSTDAPGERPDDASRVKARDGALAALRSLLWVAPNSIFEVSASVRVRRTTGRRRVRQCAPRRWLHRARHAPDVSPRLEPPRVRPKDTAE